MNHISGVSDQVLRDLGARVRAARHARGMTAAELARSSGLSLRFVLSVEGGTANPSVLVLVGVSRALGCAVSELLVDASAGGEAHGFMPRPLALTGLRGAGKSTIGKAVAERLRVPFVELDDVLARDAGMPVGEVFEVHGATHVRKLEREAWESVLRGPACVVATAGGLVTEATTYERVLSSALVVWLRASAEDHLARVREQGDTRPMANRVNAMRDLRAILRARRALYERAHHAVDTSRLGVERSVERVVALERASERGGSLR